MKIYKTLQNTHTQNVLFIKGNWSANLESQQIPGITGKFGLGIQNEAGQRLTEFCEENSLVIANTLFQQHERQFYKDLQDLLELTPKIDIPFIIGD